MSVNDNTPQNLCKVQYPEFTDAIKMCISEGKNCKISRSDMKAAFRNLGILRSHWYLLVMKAKNPVDKKYYYFFDKCLAFGALISCSHFQRFSDSVAHIVKFHTGKPNLNYLDDYLFASLVTALCNQQVHTFLDICRRINFPVSIEKMYWATNLLTFLGFLIDTVNQCISIPVEKVQKGKDLVSMVTDKGIGSKVTVKQLQKICSFLNFLGRCIVPGRAFTRRLYTYTSSTKLKPHHHVRVDRSIMEDLTMWVKFLDHPSVYCRPFMDYNLVLVATELNFFTDASGVVGMGGVSEQDWMMQFWDKEFLLECQPSIGYLELFALVAGVKRWIWKYKNQRVCIFCDNLSVVQMVNTTSSSCMNCMVLIHMLVLQSMIHNVRIFAKHLRSAENFLADALSRGRLDIFKEKALIAGRRFNATLTPIPDDMWLISKIWVKQKQNKIKMLKA